MRPERHNNNTHGAESGYALILVMFFLALLVLGLTAAAPTVLSNIQREKETEMIWRGRQYGRGIRLYLSKTKKYPTSLDDLTKPTTGIRFMRQAYKDPMNQVDGSWRLIYVGPNGQIIGSLNSASIVLTAPGITGAQVGVSSFSAGSGGGSMNGGASSLGSFGFGSSQTTGSIQNGAVGTAMTNGTSTDDPLQPHSLAGPMDASNTIGGNIIGVGSKVDKKSFMVYHGAQNYKNFEFLSEPPTRGSASAGIGNPIQNMNGANPAGTAMPNSTLPTGSNAGDGVNQRLPGLGPAPELPPLPAPPPNQ
jgi:type II secretory pathway pseudopilin PulG